MLLVTKIKKLLVVFGFLMGLWAHMHKHHPGHLQNARLLLCQVPA
jgi:hypothetical protein